jgi:predicted 3-demethylubiquinone-9 3-methyltransferase (glyoxalase superfamily)
MQKITPFLWFEGNAEEAVDFYVSVFKKAKKGEVTRYGEAGPGPVGEVMVVEFQIDGQEFVALNGNAEFKFNESISFVVNCQTQKEVDYYWEKLSKGGKKVACGWLRDKFGVAWQITPTILMKLVKDKDAAKRARVMKAMMKMVKIDIEKIKKAANGK